jgi:hypothetical protein
LLPELSDMFPNREWLSILFPGSPKGAHVCFTKLLTYDFFSSL